MSAEPANIALAGAAEGWGAGAIATPSIMYAPLEPLNAGVCGEPAPPLSNWYSVVFPFPSVAPSVHGAVAVVADPSRHANDTASLLIGGVTTALDWLQE